MDPQRVDWGVLFTSLMIGDRGRDRARAMWDACMEVIEHPDAYRPVWCNPMPPILERKVPRDILEYRVRAEDEHHAEGRNVVRALGMYRAHVTEVEAANAGRLFILASTLRTLADLASMGPTRPELVHARIADLGAFIERTWRVPVPLTGEIRSWATRATRRYDLLPVAMREV